MEIRQRTIRRNFKKVITSRVAIPYTMQHRMKKYYLQGKEISEIEFGVRNSVPSAKEIKEAIKDGFPNGATYKLIVPTSVCINQ